MKFVYKIKETIILPSHARWKEGGKEGRRKRGKGGREGGRKEERDVMK